MKQLLFTILLFSSSTFSYHDLMFFNFNFTKLEKRDYSEFDKTDIPEPTTSGYTMDNVNIMNGGKTDELWMNVFSKNNDSIRPMDYYDNPRDPLDGENSAIHFQIYEDFNQLENSWIEMKDGKLVITIWPQKGFSDEWCRSLVITGDESQGWEDLEMEPGESITMNARSVVYDGKYPYHTAMIASGIVTISMAIPYDRQEHADSIQAYEDSVLSYQDSIRVADSIAVAVADSIRAYQDSVFAYQDSVRISDSLAVLDSIASYEDSVRVADSIRVADSLATPVVYLRRNEPVEFKVRYSILGRRVNGVAPRRNLTFVERRRSR